MTFQLPAKETETFLNFHREEVTAVTEYFLVRVGTGQSVHLGAETTYSDGRKYLDATCGADSGIHRRGPYKVNAPAPTCKNCLKKLDKMNS